MSVPLLLMTDGFPYGHGEQFLETEIQYLARLFQPVVVIPRSLRQGQPRPLPDNVIVDAIYVRKRRTRPARFSRTFANILRDRTYYIEIMTCGTKLLHPAAAYLLFAAVDDAIVAECSFHEIKNSLFPPRAPFIIYTYWFRGYTFGAARLKRKERNATVVTRAHRGDLYENIRTPAYLPLRKQTLSLIDRVYTVSDDGYNYLLSNYPTYASKYEVSRLGVRDPRLVTGPSKDNHIRVMSCSSCTPVKRVHLIPEGLKIFAEQDSKRPIHWSHIGDGPDQTKIERWASANLPQNVSFTMLGYVSNQDVLSFYKNNPIDAFINVSASEGIPVSIMEAQSFGVPVIATAVGGVPEIVNNDLGVLLSPDPTPRDLAAALRRIISIGCSPDSRLRESVRDSYTKRYNAESNYQHFAERMLQFSQNKTQKQ